jgi:hypothetical protein
MITPRKKLKWIDWAEIPSTPSGPEKCWAPILRVIMARAPVYTIVVRAYIEKSIFPHRDTAAIASVPNPPIQ